MWLLAENNMENPAIVTRQNLNNHYNMKEEDWYNRVYSGNGTPFILGVHEDSGSTSNEKIVSVARSIVSPTDGSFLGMFVINIKANDFAALWYNGQADDRIIAVADKENHLIMNPNAAKRTTWKPIFRVSMRKCLLTKDRLLNLVMKNTILS